MKNAFIYAVNANGKHGFDIFICFSGHMEHLMFHRHNALLYKLLKDGVRTDRLSRLTPRQLLAACYCPRSAAEKLVNSVRHLNAAVTNYLAERSCCNPSGAAVMEPMINNVCPDQAA